MKTLYNRILTACIALLCVSFLFAGCSNDDDLSGEIDRDSLPYYANAFLYNSFPDEIPDKIEKLKRPDETTGIQYIVTLTGETIVEFDDEGAWQNVKTGHQPLSAAFTKLVGEDIIGFVAEKFPDTYIVEYSRKYYGQSVTLNNGDVAGFAIYNNEFLGLEIKNEAYVLPEQIRSFIQTHFSGSAEEAVLRNPFDNTLQIWLDNGFELSFDTNNDWTAINGFGQWIPDAIIESLPEEILMKLSSHFTVLRLNELQRSPTGAYVARAGSSTYMYDPNQKPIVYPDVTGFIREYFGDFKALKISYNLMNEIPLFDVSLPNGFDFTVDEQGNWLTMNGHGFAFPSTLNAILPDKINEYIVNHSDAGISKAYNNESYGYYIELVNGTGFMFDNRGNCLGEMTKTLTPYEKTVEYMRFHYPEEYNIYYIYYYWEGWTYTLSDGTSVQFDSEGNLRS